MATIMKRIKLRDRKLPNYTTGEEIMNMVTHIAGGGIGMLIAVLCCIKAAISGNPFSLIGCCVFAVSIIGLYAMSSIYHGLKQPHPKK